MMFAIIDRFIGVVAGVYENRLTGRAKAKIGRANLLVSRIMMFAIIDRFIGVVAGVYENSLTGRFALPNRKNRHLDF
jgi:uncharacterized membrane protein